MNRALDITLTHVAADGFRLTTQSELGASFVAAHLPDYSPDRVLPATEARALADKAQQKALAVRIE